MKYVLQMIETDLAGNETRNNVTFTFHANTLTQVLEKYTEFLKGCGFVFNGQVDIVSDEQYFGLDPEYGDHGGGSTLDDYPEIKSEILAQQHSTYYFDKDRNK